MNARLARRIANVESLVASVRPARLQPQIQSDGRPCGLDQCAECLWQIVLFPEGLEARVLDQLLASRLAAGLQRLAPRRECAIGLVQQHLARAVLARAVLAQQLRVRSQ